MPLLMCPNCNSSMQTVNRTGVEFDMCPQCRGVWLDRGELEKLMQMSRDEGGAAAPAPPPQSAPPPRDYRDDPRRHDDYRSRPPYRGDDDHYRHRKRKGFDLFDIFD